MATGGRLVLGPPRALLNAWLKGLERRRADPFGPLQVLVPTRALARTLTLALALRPGGAAGVAVTPLDQRVRDLAPVTQIPPGTREVMAAALSPDLAGMPGDIPGLYLNAIDAAMECRLAGAGPGRLKGRVPWHRLPGWIGERLEAAGVADVRRLYTYAARALRAPGRGPVEVYGFDEASPAEALVLDALAASGPLEVWTPDTGAVPPGWLRFWRRRGLAVERLDGSRDPAPAAVEAGGFEEAAELALALVAGPGPDADGLLLAGASLEEQPDILRLARAAGVPLEASVPAAAGEPGARVWTVFWRVAAGEALRAETGWWLEVALADPGGPAAAQAAAAVPHRWRAALGAAAAGRQVERARDWYRRLGQAASWAAVAGLVEEALALHPAYDWSALRAWLPGFARWDAMGLPVRARALESLLARPFAFLPPVAAGTPGGIRLYPAGEARGLPARRLVLLGLAEGRFPARPRVNPLWPPDLRAELGLPGPQALAARERRRLEVLMAGAEETVAVGLAARPGGAVRWPFFLHGRLRPLAPPPPLVRPRPPAPGAEAWYRAHRDPGAGFGPYDGLVGPPGPHAGLPEASATRLETLGRCPLAYFYRYGLDLPEPLADDGDRGLSPALLGQWAHRALEVLFREGPARPADLGALSARMEAILEQAAARNPGGERLAAGFGHLWRRALARQLAEAVFRQQEWAGEPLGVEQEIRWQEASAAGPWPFRARIDRVDRTGPEEVELVDYKTGSVLPAPDRPAPANLQPVLYRRGWARANGLDPAQVGVRLAGVLHANRFQVRRQTLPWPRAEARLLGILAGMEEILTQGRLVPVPHGQDYCRSCGFRALCPGGVLEEAREKRRHHPEWVRLWEEEGEEPDA